MLAVVALIEAFWYFFGALARCVVCTCTDVSERVADRWFR